MSEEVTAGAQEESIAAATGDEMGTSNLDTGGKSAAWFNVLATAASRAEEVASKFTGCELSAEENAVLLAAFQERVDRYASLLSVDQLLGCMSDRLQTSGLEQLAAASTAEVPVFGVTELRRVLAYADFAEEVLKQAGPLSVEVRVEGWRAYCLVPPEATVLRTAAGRSLLWVHDEEWALARFHDGGSDLGLCGQFLGKSKFVTPCSKFPATKHLALDALGLRGYPAFDKPGTLYVVRADLSPTIMKQAAPGVPLLYNVGRADNPSATSPTAWAPEIHFQEGAMPGFTSGLKAELVMNTFRLSVGTVGELESAGVTCMGLTE